MRGRKFVAKEDLLKRNYIQTNSVVYRWRFVEEDIRKSFPDDILPGDWYLHLLHAQVGNIAFLPDVMSVYRKNEGGIWFDSNARDKKYGLQIVKFHYNVWKNFADSSKDYLNRTVLPAIKSISDVFYKNLMFDKLQILKEAYPDLYSQALNIEDNFSLRCKKYRKLSNILIIVAIVELLVFICVFCLFEIN